MKRLSRISLVTAGADGTEAFYRDALGFERVGIEERGGDEFARLVGIPGARARALLLRLGRDMIELVAFAPPGRPYPSGSTSFDLWFQHLAIVVSDMGDAYARLGAVAGWTAISTDGPQRLPESSGGVTAFKFRDPEGHPLELLEFPPGKAPPAWQARIGKGPWLGIDHSAIAVADTAASIAFYEPLGFAITARSLNQGIEQERLDNASGAVVEVTALTLPDAPGPHLELLGYRHPTGRPAPPMDRTDVAKTRLILETDKATAAGPLPAWLRDPDGHELAVVAAGAGSLGSPVVYAGAGNGVDGSVPGSAARA